MAHIRSLCHARTVLRITVPNIDRTYEGDKLWEQGPCDGWRSHAMAPFEHVHGFTPRSLRALVCRLDFKSIPAAWLLRVDPVLFTRQLAAPVFSRLAATKLLVTPA